MPPVRFSVKKALAAFALFCLCLGVMRPQTAPQTALAIVIASACSGVVLLTRRQDLTRVISVGAGSVVGAFAGMVILGEVILESTYGYDHGFGETAISYLRGGIIGILWGASVAAGLVRRKKQDTEPKGP